MERQFLVVAHRGLRYALDTASVREAVWLPELARIDELPPHVRGVFNLRGRVVPMIDLDLRFGGSCQPLQRQHQVVIVEDLARSVGILVHELHDVITVAESRIEDIANFDLPGGQRQFLAGAIMADAGLILLLDVSAILSRAVEPDATAIGAATSAAADLAIADIDVLRRRRLELERRAVPEPRDTAIYAMADLDGEVFGFPIAAVREFVHLRGLTPIPCAPAHVAGNMNLRGDLLAVLDIRSFLGLAATAAAEEVIVLDLGPHRFGVRVGAIADLAHIGRSAILPLASGDAGARLCRDTVVIDGRVAGLIDAQRLIDALRKGLPDGMANPKQHT